VIAGGVTFSLDLPPGLAFVGSAADFCDIDRDGDVDLVLGASVYHENRVLVNDGFGRFRHASATFPPDHFGFVNSSRKVFCSDLDLDGWPDVVMLNTGENRGDDYISVWLNRGDLVFEEGVLFDQRGGETEDLKRVVDVNGDGWPDILLTAFPPDGALLLNSGGDGFVSLNLPIIVGGSLVDADGDGKLDYLSPGDAPEGGEPGVPPRLWYQR
jgi:hypothetical protein